MHVQVDQQDLKRALGVVLRAVPDKSTMPVLSNILLKTVTDDASGNYLWVEACDMGITLSTWLPATVNAPGTITLPAKMLSEFIATLPPARLDLRVDTEALAATVTSGRAKGTFKGIDADEFPQLGTVEAEGATVAYATAQDLIRGLQATVFSIAKNDNRPVLGTLMMQFPGADCKAILGSSDSFRAGLIEIEMRSLQLGRPVALIPRNAAMELLVLLGKHEGEGDIELTLTAKHNLLVVRTSGGELVTRLVEGNFPDLNRFMGQTRTGTTTLARDDMLRALRQTLVFTKETTRCLALTFTPGDEDGPGDIALAAATPEQIGAGGSAVDCVIAGEAPMLMYLNGAHLEQALDAAQHLSGDRVTLETQGPRTPLVMRIVGQDDYRHLIVPMSVPEAA